MVQICMTGGMTCQNGQTLCFSRNDLPPHMATVLVGDLVIENSEQMNREFRVVARQVGLGTEGNWITLCVEPLFVMNGTAEEVLWQLNKSGWSGACQSTSPPNPQ